MTSKKCKKILMGLGLPRKEANRMIVFLSARKIPRSGVIFTVWNPPNRYGKESADRIVWINGTNASTEALVRAALPERVEV